MSYTKANYLEADPVAGGMHFLRDELDCDNMGITVLDANPGWTGKSHDHTDDGQEEVYFLAKGAATMTVDGESVVLDAGDAVRVPPDATRQIRNGDVESKFVIVGAP